MSGVLLRLRLPVTTVVVAETGMDLWLLIVVVVSLAPTLLVRNNSALVSSALCRSSCCWQQAEHGRKRNLRHSGICGIRRTSYIFPVEANTSLSRSERTKRNGTVIL